MNKDAKSKISVEGGLRTENERLEAEKNCKYFTENPDGIEKRLENFPKYVRRQNLTRFLALYELYKLILGTKGSIVECGVFKGFGIMSWTKLAAVLEPVNLTRRIYGFDSFAGFPSVSSKDKSESSGHIKEGDLASDSYNELLGLIGAHDATRFLGHIKKTHLIAGDATVTIPRFVEENPHLLVSLLFLDFDLYEPTKVALEAFVPRMHRGSIIAFDELDNPLWPGETLAMLEFFRERKLAIRRFEFDPYIGYAVIE